MGEGRSIKLSGVGLHSGNLCNLEFQSASERRSEIQANGEFQNLLVQLSFPGFNQKYIQDLLALPRSAARSTILHYNSNFDQGENLKSHSPENSSQLSIRTPEHLLATLLFFADQPVLIHSDGTELPGLDGSALPYRDALANLFPLRAKHPAWHEYPSTLEWSHEWDYGRLSVKPAEKFRVHYSLERKGLHQAFTLENATVAWHEILPARTFAFHEEWQGALTSGLMKGANLNSGVLLADSENQYSESRLLHPDWPAGPFPLLNTPAWRMELEPVKHKILDLLGDLALNGLALPKLDIEICNGGHSIHHLLLEKLSLN